MKKKIVIGLLALWVAITRRLLGPSQYVDSLQERLRRRRLQDKPVVRRDGQIHNFALTGSISRDRYETLFDRRDNPRPHSSIKNVDFEPHSQPASNAEADNDKSIIRYSARRGKLLEIYEVDLTKRKDEVLEGMLIAADKKVSSAANKLRSAKDVMEQLKQREALQERNFAALKELTEKFPEHQGHALAKAAAGKVLYDTCKEVVAFAQEVSECQHEHDDATLVLNWLLSEHLFDYDEAVREFVVVRTESDLDETVRNLGKLGVYNALPTSDSAKFEGLP